MKFRNSALSWTVAAAIITASVFVTTGARANLIMEGDFAGCTGQTCPGWTFTPNGGVSNFNYGPSSFFASGANFGGLNFEDRISQSFATTAGHIYQVSFQLAADSNQNTAFYVYFDGSPYFGFGLGIPTTVTTISFGAFATSTNSTLTFGGWNDVGWDHLSNVVVTDLGFPASPAPTPGRGLMAFALLIISGLVNRTSGFLRRSSRS